MRKLHVVPLVGLSLLFGAPAAAQDFTSSLHDSYSNNRSAIMGSHQAKLRAKKMKSYRAQRHSSVRGLTLEQLKQRQYARARARDRFGY